MSSIRVLLLSVTFALCALGFYGNRAQAFGGGFTTNCCVEDSILGYGGISWTTSEASDVIEAWVKTYATGPGIVGGPECDEGPPHSCLDSVATPQQGGAVLAWTSTEGCVWGEGWLQTVSGGWIRWFDTTEGAVCAP